jgi:hypothetical protein
VLVVIEADVDDDELELLELLELLKLIDDFAVLVRVDRAAWA